MVEISAALSTHDILAAASACATTDAYCDALGLVAEAVGADNYCFMPWKPSARSPVDDFRLPGASSELKAAYLKRFHFGDPAYFHLLRTPAPELTPFRMSDLLDWGELTRRPLYSEFMRELLIHHTLCIPLLSSGRLVANLSLFRRPGVQPFQEAHCLAARSLSPILALSLQIVWERERAASLQDALGCLEQLDDALIALDEEDRLLFWSRPALAYLPALGLGEQVGMRPILHELRDALLLSRTQAESADADFSTIATADGRRLGVQITRTHDGKSLLKVLNGFRDLTPSQRMQQAGLTARQREVAIRAGMGATNAEIAAELGISERTVENHMGTIFDRVGVHRRSQLAAFFTV